MSNSLKVLPCTSSLVFLVALLYFFDYSSSELKSQALSVGLETPPALDKVPASLRPPQQ